MLGMRARLAELVVLSAGYAFCCHSLVWAQLGVSAASSASTDNSACGLASSSIEKRPSDPQVTVTDLLLEGDLHMAYADQEQIIASLKRARYSGSADSVADEVIERVTMAWQDRGYFKVQVRGDAKMLTGSPTSSRIAVTAMVNEGQQYRLRKITFKNNIAIRNTQALRNLFPIKDGDVFSRKEIAKGLENLSKAYGQLGYVNFTSIPNTGINDEQDLIDLDIDVDEGKQFYVSSVNLLGLDEIASHIAAEDLLLKPGDVYNQRLANRFVESHASLLPTNSSPDSRIHLKLDEKSGTVAVTFDFRHCTAD
jgi:surface antigen-like variable number repeat protein